MVRTGRLCNAIVIGTCLAECCFLQINGLFLDRLIAACCVLEKFQLLYFVVNFITHIFEKTLQVTVLVQVKTNLIIEMMKATMIIYDYDVDDACVDDVHDDNDKVWIILMEMFFDYDKNDGRRL